MRYLYCASVLRVFAVLSIVVINVSSQAQISEKAQICTEIEQLKFAVANVLATDPANPSKGSSCGTAFYVDPDGYLLTCAHVIDSIPQNFGKTILVNDVPTSFEVVKLDRFLDLALLHSNTKPRCYVAISEENYPNPGLHAIFAGFPDRPADAVGLPPVSIKQCMVSGLEPLISSVPNNPLLHVKVDQLSFFGNSGGPLLSASDMVLIGVMRSVAPSVKGAGSDSPIPGGYSYATSAKNIRAFISDIAQKAAVTSGSDNQTPVAWLKFRISQELRDHNDCLAFDVNLFENSVNSRQSGKEPIQPPFKLSTAIWEEIWFDSRSSKLFNRELLDELRNYYLSAKAFNELLQARESIRLSQWALSSRGELLQIHDQELLTRTQQLKATLTNLISKLQ